MTAQLRVGIVGSSFGGAVHVPAFRAQGRFEVIALASPRNAATVARERNVPQAFGSLEEMLNAVDLDVVAIASPPFAHRDAVLTALAHGKHVLCEKPFSLSVAASEELVAAETRAGTVCAIAHEFRYTPARRAMRELIDHGHLGPLREIELTHLASNLRAAVVREPSWWFEHSRGGGIAGAILSHLIDQAMWLARRPPLRVCGFSRTANAARPAPGGATFVSDVADGAFALLDFGEGLVARLTVDGTRAIDSSTLAVHGETRAAAITGPTMLEVTMFTIDADETAELDLKPDPHAKLAAVHPNVVPFVGLLDEFVHAIDGEPAALPTFSDGLETQRVLAALGYESEPVE